MGPLAAIGTIFTGADMPNPTPANVVIGLVTHMGLSIVFGIGFALLAAALAPLRTANALLLMAAGAVYGLALYLVNFQVFGNLFFPFFGSDAIDHSFQIWVHAVYGFLVAPFFIGLAHRLWPTATRR